MTNTHGENEILQNAPLVIAFDDSRLTLSYVAGCLQPQFEVVTASTMKSFSDALIGSSGRLTVVLVDVNLKAHQGSDVVRALLAGRPPGMAFLLFSSEPAERLRALCVECGADGYVRKSANPEEIVAAVAGAVERVRRPIVLALQCYGDHWQRAVEQMRDQVSIVDVTEANLLPTLSQGYARGLIVGHQMSAAATADLSQRVRVAPGGTIAIVSLTTRQCEPGLIGKYVNAVCSIRDRPEQFAARLMRLLWVSPRRECRLPVKIRSANGTEVLAFSRDLSASGLLAICHKTLDMHTNVDMTLKLENHDVTLKGKVARHHPSDESAFSYGFEFVDAPPEMRTIIAQYVFKYWVASLARFLT